MEVMQMKGNAERASIHRNMDKRWDGAGGVRSVDCCEHPGWLSQVMSLSAAAFQSDLTWNYTTISSVVLACYEYLFTVDHEVDLLWHRKWSAATWFFVANRYFMLVTVLIVAVPYTQQTCYTLPLQLFLCALDLVPVVIAAAFSALRVFALMDRGRYAMSAFVLFLGLIPVIVNAYYAHWVAYRFIPELGDACYIFFGPAVSASINLYLSLAGRLSLILADIIVLIVTWTKTFSDVRQATVFRVPAGLPGMLLRDGSVYFIAMMALNIAQLVLASIPALLNENPVTTIAQVVQAIFISRFLVNLRNARNTEEDSVSASLEVSRLSTMHFNTRSIVGNMGEPLEHENEARWIIGLEEIDAAQDEHSAVLRHEVSNEALAA